VPADRVQVGGVSQGQLDQGEAGDIAGGHPELVQVVEQQPGPVVELGSQVVPAAPVDLQAQQGRGQRGHRHRAPYTYEGTITLRYRLSVVGKARKASSDE
jgi:hypothetical protein